MLQTLLLPIFLLFIAITFSAVGHGGASGYTAILLLFGYTPESLRATVLSMNIVVTLWVLLTLNQQILVNKRLFFILILSSTPTAFLGGSMQINTSAYRIVLGILLLISAIRLLITLKDQQHNKQPALISILLTGTLLGWLSGLTGIGGGVLLSPLLLLFGWCTMRDSIPIVAGFILINSIAGLLGYWQHYGIADNFPWWMLGIAFVGAITGSYWAKISAKSITLVRLLAIILVVAGSKMLITAF